MLLRTAAKQLSEICRCHLEHGCKSHDQHLSRAAVQVGPLVGCGVGAFVVTVTVTPEI